MPCSDCGQTMQQALADVAPDMPGSADMRPFSGLSWSWAGSDVLSRLKTVLSQWEGTPYMAGQRCRGVGVDCVQFTAAVLDTLYRRPTPTHVPRLGPDSAAHDVRQAFSTIKALRRSFPSDVVRDRTIQAGDIVLVRAVPNPHGPRRPGHVLIAGTVPWIAFHAVQGAGVCQASLLATSGILRVYRTRHKERWA